MRAAYALATDDREADVLEIADRARAGDEAAVDLLRTATRKLGAALAPAIREFGAEIVVVGGSMTGSWDLLGPWFEQGLDWPTAPPVLLSQRVDTAALIGAAALVVGVC